MVFLGNIKGRRARNNNLLIQSKLSGIKNTTEQVSKFIIHYCRSLHVRRKNPLLTCRKRADALSRCQMLSKIPTRPRLHARKVAAHFPAHAPAFTLQNGWSCMTSSPRADSQNTAFRRPGALERQWRVQFERRSGVGTSKSCEQHAMSFCFYS